MITLDHVSKKFDKRFGVRDITTEIPSGCVCGWLARTAAENRRCCV